MNKVFHYGDFATASPRSLLARATLSRSTVPYPKVVSSDHKSRELLHATAHFVTAQRKKKTIKCERS
jgi:hypothetical protein